jgi:hypothetical protein
MEAVDGRELQPCIQGEGERAAKERPVKLYAGREFLKYQYVTEHGYSDIIGRGKWRLKSAALNRRAGCS